MNQPRLRVAAALFVLGGLFAGLVVAVGQATAQDMTTPIVIPPEPVAVAVAPPPALAVPVVQAPITRTGYSAEDWIKIIGAVGVLIGSISAPILVVLGNRERRLDAADARAAAARRETMTAAIGVQVGALPPLPTSNAVPALPSVAGVIGGPT